jgi:chromosome segregation ATPase
MDAPGCFVVQAEDGRGAGMTRERRAEIEARRAAIAPRITALVEEVESLQDALKNLYAEDTKLWEELQGAS